METKIERFNRELELLKKYNFLPYFAVLTDIIRHGQRHGVKMISRGSASGSYLWYLAGGSQLDPLKHNLMFERFLAELRLETGELPDIDIDIAASGRHIVQEYAKERWGFEPVGTLLTYSHSSIVRLIERIVFKIANIRIPKSIVDEASDADPDAPFENAAFKRFMNLTHFEGFPQNWAEDLYEKLNGARAGYGRHACAVVPLRASMPVPFESFASESSVAYTESGSDKTLQYCGFVKYDFLSSETLDSIALLEKLTGVEAPKEIADDDPCLKMFELGDVTGLFQFDTNTAKKVVALMNENNRPINTIRILADITSLGRPGPLQQEFHIAYAKRDADLSIHPPLIREIFEQTGGVLIYQEQVAELFAKVAFQTYDSHAKEYGIVALKSLVPKNQKVAATEKFQKGYEKLHKMFIEGGLKHGFDKLYLETLFKSLDGFIRYGFNLSHALAYANLSAQQAWFKHHYPEAFWTVLLNNQENNANDREKLLRYIVEAIVNYGINIVPPHVNVATSQYVISPDRKSIYCPIDIVVGLGVNVMQSIVAEREANGPYASLADFNQRVKINTSLKRKLYNAGMLDGLPGTLYDLGVQEIKHFVVKGMVWEVAKVGTVANLEGNSVALTDGTKLTFAQGDVEVQLEAKRLKMKPAPDINDLKVGTTIKYYALENKLVNFKRVSYYEPLPEPVSRIEGIKAALGFALPTNLKQIIADVANREDERIGYVVEIYDKVSKGGTPQRKIKFQSGKAYWFAMMEPDVKHMLTKNVHASTTLERINEIQVGDLVRLQLKMNINRRDDEPEHYGQIRFFKVLA